MELENDTLQAPASVEPTNTRENIVVTEDQFFSTSLYPVSDYLVYDELSITNNKGTFVTQDGDEPAYTIYVVKAKIPDRISTKFKCSVESIKLLNKLSQIVYL